MIRLLRLTALVVAAGVLAPRIAPAQDTTFRGVTINGQYDASRDKSTIVVLPVAGVFGDSIGAIIQRDLDYGDRFTIVPIDSTNPAAVRGPGGSGLNYQLFQSIGAQYVAEITQVPIGLHIALHDVAHSTVANVQELPLPSSGLSRDWRMAVHRASDQIQQWVTGQPGIAATRIAYMRGQSIRVIDSDGADEITLPTEPNGISPAWNPSSTTIAYTTYGPASHLVVMDVATGRAQTLMGPTRNVSYTTPVFSPDGTHIVYTRAGEAESDLYSVPVTGGAPTRLTAAMRGVDNSSPTFRPDGRQIVYMSDALGRPELYIMDSDGTEAQVLTQYDFSEKNYRTDPDWSPDGRLIAYGERLNDKFQLRTIPATGGTPKLLTSDGENEQPAWAPDSRHLVFTSSRTGVRQLWILDAESGRFRQLTHAAGSRLPAWSTRLGGGQ